MKRIFFSLLFLFSAVFQPLIAASVVDNLTAEVKYLADDAREGRGIGTKGLDQAADYLAKEMKDMGLKPAFGDSYFQPFTMGWGVHLGPKNTVTVGEVKADTSSGIMPYGFSSPGTVTGPVIFAGYGIIAPEYQYDDFAEINVKDAIVLCLTGEPGEFDSTSKFEGLSYTAHSGLRNKAGNAKLKGAVAILYVEGPIYAGTDKEVLSVPRSDEPYIDCGIPALRITREAVKKLFPDFELDKLQRSIDSNTQPRSLAIESNNNAVSATVSTDLTRESVPVKNVGGIIPGDPKSIIVLGAHYDHLGRGQSGSLEEKPGLIHHGADDNASGDASILETARMLMKHRPKSTVMIVNFTAEETGLGGSGHLVKNFPLGMENVKVMVNLDMVGRMKDNKFNVLSCKTATEFETLIPAVNKESGANFDITCKGDGYGPSDHMNFFLADKPVLFLFTGAHADYHRSSDTWDKINYPDMARVVNFTSTLIHDLDEKPLTFVKATEPPPDQGGRFRVTFGTIPDYAQADSLVGVLLSGVREGGPAASCGIKGGDLLTKMGDVKLNNIYDFVFALRKFAPGDSVEVHYIRNGQELVTHAVLKASKQQ